MVISMLYPMNICKAWPEIEPMMADVLALSGTHGTEDVRRLLLSGQAQLWVQWNERVEAFMVTEFVTYPKGTWLRIWLGGATRGAKVDWKDIRAEATKFAEMNRCAGLRIEGREGWLKHFPDATKQATILTYPLPMEIH
jgi:hypothetical protein